VILTPEDGMLHNLNPVATRIFELANGKRTVKDIIKRVLEEFQADEKAVTRDVPDFIDDLLHKKMLILSSKPLKV